MHTAVHLVSNCLGGPLAVGRTIILVTHHISLCLPVASYLVEISNGTLLRNGTIQDFERDGLLQTVVEVEEFPPEAQPQTSENEADGLTTEIKPYARSRPNNGKLIEVEARAEGRVSMRTYLTYIRAAGVFSWIVTIFLMVLIRFINIGNQVRDANSLLCSC